MKFIIRIACAVILLAVIGAVYIHSLPWSVVAVGAPVRQDDFVYTVTRVVKHRENENVVYVVTIRVDNQAKVIDYQWRDETAFVTDSAGAHYRARALSDPRNGNNRPPIVAGESAAYDLTFEIPAIAQHPMLHYWNGIMMGDMFDGAAYGRAAVAL